VKRHPALVPLSHDHHHALVQARRLRRAADTPDAASAATAFARFFAQETVRHFREEEESLFPLAVDHDEARPLIVQALLEHQRLHALVARLDGSPELGDVMRELGELLEAHVRLEERELFPLLERLVPLAARAGARGPTAGGPVWGEASEDLNATLLAWEHGGGPPEHVNEERDVFLVVLEGSATVRVDEDEHELAAGDALIVGKGRRRKITAGRDGVRYLAVHRRRPPLQIRSRR
jgi:quercetin dioxygenase-like cupin family protein